MQQSVVDVKSKEVIRDIELSELFTAEYKEPMVHQVVNAYLAGARSGTKAQKTRSEVRGGGIKPWRQKGTGRARAGTIRSPLWRSGGVTFAAKPRSFKQKINKKMYRNALVSIISELMRLERFSVIDEVALTSHKTKDVAALFAPHKEGGRLLLVSDVVSDELYFGGRNLSWLDICSPELLDPITLVHASKILITEAALKQLEVQLSCK